MYNERKDSFTFKDAIIQFLFVALFIFILLWLFPTKRDLEKAIEPLYVSIFNENVASMRDAAKDYFTTARLPKNVGDKVYITLSEMLDKKLVLPFVDSQGKQCDINSSYVEVTKMDDEYIMKINLKCSDVEDYILVHMGCYNYCETAICEKQETTKPTNNTKPTPKPTTPKPTPTTPKPTPTTPTTPKPDPKPTPTPTKYLYEYIKVVGDSYTAWSSWSKWTTTKLYANDLRDVKTTTSTTYTEQKEFIGYKTVTYQEPVYEKRQVQVDTKTEKVCTKYESVYVPTGEVKYTEWKLKNKQTFCSTPTPTDTTKYVYVPGTSTDFDCGNCSTSTCAVYEVYTRTSYQVTKEQQQCAKYETKTTPIYITKEEFVGYETKTKKEPVYGMVKVPVTTTYYSYRTRDIIKGYKDVKWSEYNDTKLLNSGYQYTGNKKEVK